MIAFLAFCGTDFFIAMTSPNTLFLHDGTGIFQLWVATHWSVVDGISVGGEGHSKFKIMRALSQIIRCLFKC